MKIGVISDIHVNYTALNRVIEDSKKEDINAGSAGMPLDGDNRASYGILHFHDNEIYMVNKRVEYPIDELLDIAEQRQFPNIDKYERMIRFASL